MATGGAAHWMAIALSVLVQVAGEHVPCVAESAGTTMLAGSMARAGNSKGDGGLGLPKGIYIGIDMGWVRAGFKEEQQQDYGSLRETYPSVSVGLRRSLAGFGIGLYAFAPPSVDLVAGLEASVYLYPLHPLARTRAEPFVVLSLGSSGGEDIESDGMTGYGGGIEWRLGGKVATRVQIRRLRFSYYENVALRPTLTQIGVGLRMRLR